MLIKTPKKEKEIETDNLKIEKNTISFDDVLLQISNISQVSINTIPLKRFNLWFILLFILGAFLIKNSGYSDNIYKMIGLCFITSAGMYSLYYILDNFVGNRKHLTICLNSGSVYYIICNDEDFLKRVVNVIKYCINNHSSQKIKIDFNNCEICKSPIIVGDRNEVH